MLVKDGRAPAVSRKRVLIVDEKRPAKKHREEPKDTPRKQQQQQEQLERRFKTRTLTVVLEDLWQRVRKDDIQLANELIRELDSEHVRVMTDEDFELSSSMLLKSIMAADKSKLSKKLFASLLGVFEKGSPEKQRAFIAFLLEDETNADVLFSRPFLDGEVLELYSKALNDRIIQIEQLPEKVHLSVRRCIAQSSIGSTSNRVSGIEFLVAVAQSKAAFHVSQAPEFSDCEKLLCRLAADRDYRVRKSASEGLLKLSEAGYKLKKTTYLVAKGFMKDVDASVRITAIRLLIYYANRKAREKTADGKPIHDDAFSSICDSMNDIELAVRVEAAKKLGDFNDVSEELIYQTLDKKMMRSSANQVVKVQQSMFSMSKKAVAQHDRRHKYAKKSYKPAETTGGWSRGKELHAAAPEKKEEEEEGESIIPHGACGAFVSALEDEFMDVRKAAVYSLGRLACNRPTFAVSALEYLADMFNDEIADVRLDAINALTPLIVHGQLNSDQLNVILKCLDDAMPESRQAMRELLKRALFVDVNCVEMCVRALLACLKRFPKDKDGIYACMATIGLNHAVPVQSIMRSLLDIHLLFQTREASLEDQEYVGKLIMVLNAASEQPAMVTAMPEFVYRHYRYLRSSYPELVRPIRIIDELQSGKAVKSDETQTSERAEEIVVQAYTRLCEVSGLADLRERNIQRDDIFRDTTAISTYNENVSGASRLIFSLGEAASAVDCAASTVLLGGELTNVKQLINQNLDEMASIEFRFSGVSDALQSYLVHCRVYMLILEVLAWMMQTMAPQNKVIESMTQIIEEANKMIAQCQEVSPSLIKLLSQCQGIFCPVAVRRRHEDKRKVITPATIVGLLDKSAPILPTDFPPVSSIHLRFARITAPNKDAAVENVLRFFATLPHGIPLEFELHNVEMSEIDSVRIKTVMPDGKFDLGKPRKEEIREEGKFLTVATQVRITCGIAWSDAAEIDIIIGMLTAGGLFVPLFASPTCFTPAHVRVRIHPHSR